MKLEWSVWYCIKYTDTARRDLTLEYVMGLSEGVLFKSVSGINRNVSLCFIPRSSLEYFRE